MAGGGCLFRPFGCTGLAVQRKRLMRFPGRQKLRQPSPGLGAAKPPPPEPHGPKKHWDAGKCTKIPAFPICDSHRGTAGVLTSFLVTSARCAEPPRSAAASTKRHGGAGDDHAGCPGTLFYSTLRRPSPGPGRRRRLMGLMPEPALQRCDQRQPETGDVRGRRQHPPHPCPARPVPLSVFEQRENPAKPTNGPRGAGWDQPKPR
ncbi:uncharacterized protein VSU04_009190 isoform 2-T2 [Chlamydotis macqueenii]